MRPLLTIRLAAPLVLILGLGPASAEEAECHISRLFVLDLLGDDLGSPLVAGTVNGTPNKFMLDTGGYWGVLSNADSAGLPHVTLTSGVALLDASGAAMRTVVKVKEPAIGGVKLPSMEFYVGQFSTLGGNVLSSFDLELDPIERKASFFLPKTCGGNGVYWPHRDLAVIPFDAKDKFQIAVDVVIDGQKVDALFDTGATRSELDDRFARNTFDIDMGSLDTEVSSIGVALSGGTFREYRHRFESLDFGGVTISHPWIRIGAHGHTFFHRGHGPPLILGMDVISQLHVYISYSEHKIYATTIQGDIDAGRKPADGSNPGNRVARWNARELVASAWTDLRAGKRAEAAKDIDRAVALTPDDPETLLARAQFRFEGNDAAGATADAARALAAAPQSVEAHVIMGWLLVRAGKGEAAVAEFSTAIDLTPEVAGLLFGRTHAYAANKQYDLALADAEAFVQRAPSSAYALDTRCWIEAVMGRFAPALADCDAALAIAPKDPKVLESRGFANLKAGRLDAAITDYDAGLALNPRSAAALYGRAQAKRARGDVAAADADLAAARAIIQDIDRYSVWDLTLNARAGTVR